MKHLRSASRFRSQKWHTTYGAQHGSCFSRERGAYLCQWWLRVPASPGGNQHPPFLWRERVLFLGLGDPARLVEINIPPPGLGTPWKAWLPPTTHTHTHWQIAVHMCSPGCMHTWRHGVSWGMENLGMPLLVSYKEIKRSCKFKTFRLFLFRKSLVFSCTFWRPKVPRADYSRADFSIHSAWQLLCNKNYW